MPRTCSTGTAATRCAATAPWRGRASTRCRRVTRPARRSAPTRNAAAGRWPRSWRSCQAAAGRAAAVRGRRLSYAEIAEALGLPVGTVQSALHRARTKMRKALEDEDR
ncbi:sigma factor-like helix-turn-helix DNA-binding protein [Dactylosporangium sp. NPDC005555]|uniref:sigma factor-like helix-turn-helix DNA-binding protein n=1 Tax=Dactylosporangium sp. NPDC005555 TaxID=3154889 RepID=UPI0033A3B833